MGVTGMFSLFLLPVLPHLFVPPAAEGLKSPVGHSPRLSFPKGVCTKFLVPTLAAKGEGPLEMTQRSTDEAKEKRRRLGGTPVSIVGENQRVGRYPAEDRGQQSQQGWSQVHRHGVIA